MSNVRLSPSGPFLTIDPADIAYPPPGGSLLRVPVGGGAAEQMRGTLNGQLTYWSQTAGLWLPTATAPNNGDIPLWDASDNRWEFTPLPNLGAMRYFDNTFSPVGLWNFNSTLNDANGIASNNLALAAGNLGFCDIVPGKVGLYLYNGARYSTAALSAPLRLQGDMSFFVITQNDSIPSADQPIAWYAGSGELEAANAQWSLTFIAQTSPAVTPKRLNYLSEHGAGINDTVDSAGTVSLPPVHNIALIGFTRIANVIQFYYNGLPFGPASAAISAPTGGDDASMRLFVGSQSAATTATAPFILFSMQAIPTGLTPTQVKGVWNQSLGPAFGMLT